MSLILAMPKSTIFTKSLWPSALGEEDVLGLHVAVDDALGVGGGERASSTAVKISAAALPRQPGLREPSTFVEVLAVRAAP
jgi:hypothetical protein